MLETLLKIGHVLREEKGIGGIKHHRYIKQAPQHDTKKPIEYFSVPVDADFTFDINERVPLRDDDLIKNGLYYLNYKIADADSMKKYIFGDICNLTQTNKKTGEVSILETNFLLGDLTVAAKGFQVNSFLRGQKDAAAFADTIICKFRESFAANLEAIEELLRGKPSLYIHFNFNGNSWYQFEKEMNLLNRTLLDAFLGHSDSGSGYFLKKSLHKTLAPGAGNLPGFAEGGEYKTRVFKSHDDVMDLLYAIDYSQRAVIRERDIKIIVLPRSDERDKHASLTARQIETFFQRKALEAIEESETNTAAAPIVVAADEGADKLFSAVVEDVDEAIAQFDFIFSKAGSGPSTPDIDLVEISGLQRSRLSDLSVRVRSIRHALEPDRQRPFKKSLSRLDITRAFLNILGDPTKGKKKYQSHLFKVLPQIYNETYYDDPVLLPALIEKIEFNVRSDNANYNLLKYDFRFLMKLQNYEGDRIMEIQSSESYRIGVLLGRMARQFSGAKSPIKSFEKNYVGLLSRRITTLPDVVKLYNDINQKLVMHERSKYTFRTASELAGVIRTFQGRYDSSQCAFGFFESYFEPFQKADDGSAAPTTGDSTNDAPEGQDASD